MRHVLTTGLWLAALMAPAAAQVAAVSTSDATIMPDPRTVFIQSANVPADALVIIRAVRNGKIDLVPIGQIDLKPGETKNVRVNLMRKAQPGESLVVFLHADYGRKGVYDKNDPVVLDVDISETIVSKALGQSATR